MQRAVIIAMNLELDDYINCATLITVLYALAKWVMQSDILFA